LLVELVGLSSVIVTSFLSYTEGAAVLFPRRAVEARLFRKDYGPSLRFYPKSGQEEVGPGCAFGRTVWRGAAFDRCSEPELIAQIGIVRPRRFLSRRLPGTSHDVFHLVAGPLGNNRRQRIVRASGAVRGSRLLSPCLRGKRGVSEICVQTGSGKSGSPPDGLPNSGPFPPAGSNKASLPTTFSSQVPVASADVSLETPRA
jgi:hypothetical protein